MADGRLQEKARESAELELEMQREIDLMWSFTHPNIVTFITAFRSHLASEVWVVMELCAGGSLPARGESLCAQRPP